MRGYKTEDNMMQDASNEHNKKVSCNNKSKKSGLIKYFIFVVLFIVLLIVAYNLHNNQPYTPEQSNEEYVSNDTILNSEDSIQNNEENEAYEKKELQTGVHNGHEYVDLGLSVKWATRNIGAKAYYEYGKYFTWGDINSIKHDEYCKTFGEEIYDISGDKEYDAALSHWGGQWRLPTKTEFEELIEKCTIKEKVVGKYNGCLVTGPNGNSIFLPLAGLSQNAEFDDKSVGEVGRYWTATSNDKECAYYLDIEYGNVLHVYSVVRFYGYSIRPVYDNKERIGFDEL